MKNIKNFLYAVGFLTSSFFSSYGQEASKESSGKENKETTNYFFNTNFQRKNSLQISSGEIFWTDTEIWKSYNFTPLVRIQYERRLIKQAGIEGGLEYISKVKSDPFKPNVNKIFEYNTLKALQGNIGIKSYFSIFSKEGLTPYGRTGIEKINGFRETGQKDPSAISRIINAEWGIINSHGFYFGGGLELNKKFFGLNAGANLHILKDKKLTGIDMSCGIKLNFN